jgi:hypothetical protein
MLRPTAGRPVHLGIRHPSEAYDQNFYYCQGVASLLMWDAPSDDRTGLSFTIAAGLASSVILWSESRGTRDLILLFETPRLLLRIARLLSVCYPC